VQYRNSQNQNRLAAANEVYVTHLRLTLILLALAAAFSGCGDTSAPTFTAPPSVAANPNPAVPLAAIVSAATSEPAELAIKVVDGETEWLAPASAGLATDHKQAVLGFRPGRKHRLEVTARDQAGNVSPPETLEFETPPLPDDFPPIKAVVSVPGNMDPGVTLFSVMKWPDGKAPHEDYGLALAVDAGGEVVWYYRGSELMGDPQPLPNGNLLYMAGRNRAIEMDMLGNVVSRWHASQHPNPEAVKKVEAGSIPVATETFHHEIQKLPSGNLLTLSTEMRRLDYPADAAKPDGPKSPANVIGDIIIEFAPDGSIVKQWKLMDLLDVHRLGYDSLGRVWDIWAYRGIEGGTRDWAHTNSVFYDASDDSYLVSVRHQEAVVKLSRETGKLIWILGDHDLWKAPWKPYLLEPLEGLQWQYHSHAAKMTSRGTLLLFDNGNFRALPPKAKMAGPDSYSRAVEFAIDAKAKTVRQVWKYGGPGDEIFFSPFISEADLLPKTGNVLVTDGGRVLDKEGRLTDDVAKGHHSARVVEVTHTDPPEKVFELVVDSGIKDDPIGWAVYRSERLPAFPAGMAHTPPAGK
jgi:hypothetical protein